MSEPTETPVFPPEGAFLRGALVGIAVALPLVIATVFVLSRIGIGDPGVALLRVVKFALMFAALPAALTAGGVARLAGRAARVADGPKLPAAIRAGAVAFAPAGVGLVLLTALPLGKLPESEWMWIWIAVAGAAVGAGAGAAIGRFAAAPDEPREQTDDETTG